MSRVHKVALSWKIFQIGSEKKDRKKGVYPPEKDVNSLGGVGILRYS
jgi:hypothetical protein